MAEPLYITMLVIYIILVQPALYCLWKHGKRGILGWLYLQLFCVVRIVGSAVTIHEEDSHTGGSASVILSSVGLSPLLLAAAGVLHEARSVRNPRLNRKLEWFLVIQYHALVSAALAMVIVGVVYLEDGHTTNTTSALLKVGAALVLLSWVLLVVWTYISMRSSKTDVYAPAYAEGTRLLHGVAVVLSPIALRMIYAVVSLVLEVDRSTSGFTTSLAAKVCMSVVPEMIVTVVLVMTGLATRNISRAYSRVATGGNRLAAEGNRPTEESFTLNSKPRSTAA